jgi:hypothetical protein
MLKTKRRRFGHYDRWRHFGFGFCWRQSLCDVRRRRFGWYTRGSRCGY